jgi:hypothetical protein
LISSDRPVSAILAARILEDAGLIGEMISLLPPGRTEWRPDWPPSTAGDPPFSVSRLAAHLTESLGGVCACLYRLYPEQLAHFASLRERLGPGRFDELRQAAHEGFALMTDADLTRAVATVFAPEGEPLLNTLLINWKHLLHHGHQLFLYLKLMGVPVSSRHLYRFR